MRRIIFFLMLNTLILPLVADSTALEFFGNFAKEVEKKGHQGIDAIVNFPELISSNLMSQQYFYIKFLLSSAFVTNGINLLDTPHKLTIALCGKCHKRKHKHAKVQTDYDDTYEFELGYMYSYALVVFLNGLLFATIVPLIPVFASLYFWIKYLVDKNNLLFLYAKRYESNGTYRRTVTKFMIFNMIFYLLAISALLGKMLDEVAIPVVGLIIIALVVAIMVKFQYSDKLQPKVEDITSLEEYLSSKEIEIATTPEEKEQVRTFNIKLLQ